MSMSCGGNISTGYISSFGPCCGGASENLVASPGKNILFSPDTPQGTVFSPAFLVPAGTMVLLEAYNMPEQQPIYVNRIVKSTTAPKTVDPCSLCASVDLYRSKGVIVFRERMMLGNGSGVWQLFKDGKMGSAVQLLVAIPGLYELELSDTHMLGDLEVEYSQWAASATPYLPRDYFAGISGGRSSNGD